MKTVAEYFASFERDCIPDSASPAQRHAMRSAFYSGAFAMFNLTAACAEEHLSDDVAATRLNQLHTELLRYAVELTKGHLQ